MQKILSLLTFFFVVSASIFAQESEVYNPSKKAIRGYDPVAYFTEGKPTQGNTQFIYFWKESDWYFVSAENLQLFKKNPEKYAPQYGGYCAYGMSNGYKAPTEPDAFTIVDGKLYLNYNKDVRNLWNKKQSDYVKAADKNWPGVKNKG